MTKKSKKSKDNSIEVSYKTMVYNIDLNETISYEQTDDDIDILKFKNGVIFYVDFDEDKITIDNGNEIVSIILEDELRDFLETIIENLKFNVARKVDDIITTLFNQ